MWPFKKKVIKNELKKQEQDPLPISCVCKCILNDLENHPEQDWNIDYVDGHIEIYLKEDKYRIYQNYHYVSLKDIYFDFNTYENNLLYTAITKLSEKKATEREREKQIEANLKLKEIFPECYK